MSSARVLCGTGNAALMEFDGSWHAARMDQKVVARLLRSLDSPELQRLGLRLMAERYEDDYHDFDMITIERRGQSYAVPSVKVPADLLPFLEEVDDAWGARFGKQYRDTLAQAVLREQNPEPEH